MRLNKESRQKIISAIGERAHDWDTDENRKLFKAIERSARAYLRRKAAKKGVKRSQSLKRFGNQVKLLRTIFDELDPLALRILQQKYGGQLEFEEGQRTKQGRQRLHDFFTFMPMAIIEAHTELGTVGRPNKTKKFIKKLAKALRSTKRIRFSTVKTTKEYVGLSAKQKIRIDSRAAKFCLAVFEEIGEPRTLASLQPTMNKVVTALRKESADDSDDDDLGASDSDD
ncbi:MAG: hypothetical protein AB7P20_15715 [Rhizobiaceae bacterium]